MKVVRYIHKSGYDILRCNREADWFATAFLMPENLFREVYKKTNASMFFGVTQLAVEARAEWLRVSRLPLGTIQSKRDT